MWFISEEPHSAKKIDHSFSDDTIKTKKNYHISSFARYLIAPHPLEVQKKLIGYKIIKRKSGMEVFKTKLKRLLLKKSVSMPSAANSEDEAEYISQTEIQSPSLKDSDLEIYLQKIEDLLRAYHPALDTLARIDPFLIKDITGICIGLDGNQSSLNIKGSVREKLRYLEHKLFKDVTVILGKAHISKGLFELEGFDFTCYDSACSYHLAKSFENNAWTANVLNKNHTWLFSLNDTKLIEYLFLLELGLQVSPKLRYAFQMFIEQKAIPLRLFFNETLLIDYAKAPLPPLYQRLSARFDVDLTSHVQMIAENLNQFQVSLALSYRITSKTESDQIVTDISLLHNIKALNIMKQDFPVMYAEVQKKAAVSEIGNFYLLDCFQGRKP
jgi:hypothetical protein